MLLIFSICAGLFACGTAEQEQTGTDDTDRKEPIVTTETAETEETTETETEKNTETVTENRETEKETTQKTEEPEPEDPRLKEEFAPVYYLSAKDLYELTKDGVYEIAPSLFHGYDEVTLHAGENGKKYVKLLSYNDYQDLKEAFITLFSEKTEVAPWFAIKYRTATPGLSMEIYSDSQNKSLNAGSRAAFSIITDGEWNLATVNLQAKISQYDGTHANYFRFDFMNSSVLPVDSYMEIEYIAFFHTEKDAQLFEFGKTVEMVYIDPASGYKETSLIHNTYLDMINGMGDGGRLTFDARGGNSQDGIDTFIHNGETLAGGMLVFSGWTVVDGGVERFVWSADGGKTWHDTELYEMSNLGNVGTAHINATLKETGAEKLNDPSSAVIGGGYQGKVNMKLPSERAAGIAADLSEYNGKTVNVILAAVPKAEQDSLALIAYVTNVKVNTEAVEETTEAETEEVIEPSVDPSACATHKPSINWYPVKGEGKEQKICTLCGSATEIRDTAFAYAMDYVEDSKGAEGQLKPGKWGIVPAIVNGSSLTPRTGGVDIIFGGWIACNGGALKLVYRVNDGEWIECGHQPGESSTAGADLIAAIEGYNLGLKNYEHPGRFRVTAPLNEYAGQTVSVSFGFIPQNNDSVAITVFTVTDVKVPG